MKKISGLKLIGAETIFIDDSVVFGENVIVYPNNIIWGKSVIGSNTVLMPNNFIMNGIVGKGCTIDHSYIEDSVVGNSCKVGPFSRLRPHSKVGNNCKVGNFVEIKNSVLGDGTKASHLAYIGDSDVGKNCNIGCGAIFVNYDGLKKSRTVVMDNCFIGSNANIIAPVTISKGSYICAGSTLTKDTLENDFVIGRARETIKPNYAIKYHKN